MIVSPLRAMFGAALLAALFITAGPAMTEDLAAIDPNADVTAVAGWRVSGLSGDASARLGSAPFEPLAIGDVVPVGSDIRTAHGAVVFLSRRGDRVVIQPDTELHIGEPQASGLLTQFFQSFGNVFYDVEPRSSRSFGVKSPYMAAVVKGTRFLVTVNRDLNRVRVDEGRVLVASNDGTSSAMVGAGNVATVTRSGEGGVQTTESAVIVPPAITPKPVGITTDGATPASGGAGESQAAGASGGSSVGGTIGGAAKTAGGVVGGAVDAVGGVVGGAVDAVGGVVGGVTETAGNVVGGVGKAVGGLLSGRR